MRLVPVLALALGACASTSTVVCPALRDYTPEFEARLADEIEAAPADAAWPDAVLDYVSIRDQIKAACP